MKKKNNGDSAVVGAETNNGETATPTLKGETAAPTLKGETAAPTPLTTFDQLPVHIRDLFNYLLTAYMPCDKGNHDFKKSTAEIFEELQQHCPSMHYNQETVYLFLLEHGFTFVSPPGELSFEWVMKVRK